MPYALALIVGVGAPLLLILWLVLAGQPCAQALWVCWPFADGNPPEPP